MDNRFAHPSVSYSHFWGIKKDGTKAVQWLPQSFDFPVRIDVRKHKLTKAKSAGLDRQGMAFRQQILLQVKEVCLGFGAVEPAEEPIGYLCLRNAEQLSAFMRLVWRKEMRISLRQTRSIWNC